MPKKQIYSKAYPLRLTFRCEKAYLYLQKHKVNVSNLLRQGGEQAVIDKANEFYFKEKRNKEFQNAPDWLFK